VAKHPLPGHITEQVESGGTKRRKETKREARGKTRKMRARTRTLAARSRAGGVAGGGGANKQVGPNKKERERMGPKTAANTTRPKRTKYNSCSICESEVAESTA